MKIREAIIVFLLCLALIKIPLQIIRESFIELGGGVLQDHESRTQIEKVISENLLPDFKENTNYITKLGSSYLVVIYLTIRTDRVSVEWIETLREKITNSLVQNFHAINVEIILRK
ncbi:MAG: hypothetical protein KAR19_11355 [Bacteroidales bacterium]|nr:hypothetical protein [Bacteroidales bacterium]